jgi:hypothetical protein
LPLFNLIKMEQNNNFSLVEYLVATGWKLNNSIWKKSNKSLSVLNNGLMIALNNKIGIKHKHIVTCELPSNFIEAEIIFNKCKLNFKSEIKSENNDTENKY